MVCGSRFEPNAESVRNAFSVFNAQLHLNQVTLSGSFEMFLSNSVIVLALALFPTLIAGVWQRPKKNGSAQIQQIQTRRDPLLEVGRASRLRPGRETKGELKVVSYNIRWRGGDDLR